MSLLKLTHLRVNLLLSMGVRNVKTNVHLAKDVSTTAETLNCRKTGDKQGLDCIQNRQTGSVVSKPFPPGLGLRIRCHLHAWPRSMQALNKPSDSSAYCGADNYMNDALWCFALSVQQYLCWNDCICLLLNCWPAATCKNPPNILLGSDRLDRPHHRVQQRALVHLQSPQSTCSSICRFCCVNRTTKSSLHLHQPPCQQKDATTKRPRKCIIIEYKVCYRLDQHWHQLAW